MYYIRELKLGGHPGSVSHINMTYGWGGLQLPRTCNKAKLNPSAANKTWCYLAPTPTSLREWFLSSLAMWWILLATQEHISFCYHSHNTMATQGKTKTHAPHYWWNRTSLSSFRMLEQGYHVYQFRLWHCTKSEYWLALPNVFWQSWMPILEYAIGKHGFDLQTRMWYVPQHALQISTTPLYMLIFPSDWKENGEVRFVGLM